jgi:hypothetical protein
LLFAGESCLLYRIIPLSGSVIKEKFFPSHRGIPFPYRPEKKLDSARREVLWYFVAIIIGPAIRGRQSFLLTGGNQDGIDGSFRQVGGIIAPVFTGDIPKTTPP